jgi:hypothetical protein
MVNSAVRLYWSTDMSRLHSTLEMQPCPEQGVKCLFVAGTEPSYFGATLNDAFKGLSKNALPS